MNKLLCKCVPVLAVFTVFSTIADAQISKVVNGASLATSSRFSPGTIITIRGTNLAPGVFVAPDPTRPPRTLGGVTVTIGGVACVLFYVSPAQINAVVDPTAPLGSRTLVVTTPSRTFSRQIEIVTAGAPGIFSMFGTGARDGAVLNAVTYLRGPFSVSANGRPTYLALFATGLDLTTKPRVTVDGIEVPVLWAGLAPGFTGLQQINVELLPQLAGAGRVDVVITAGGRTTNVVEIVILPNKGQGPFAPEQDNEPRNRELASIAWVPNTSLALLTDEENDVVRVLDLKNRRVSRTIALPKGAHPVAVAAMEDGKTALVAERDRDRVAILDLTTYRVIQEVRVGGGPSAIAINSNVAVVLNMDTDNVSILNITTRTVIGTVEVGRSPRDIASDLSGGTWRAYVTNQNDGTITVIDVPQMKVVNTLMLGEDVRPQSIIVLSGLGIGIVTEPSRNQDGRVLMVNLNTGVILAEEDANPERNGGASDLAVFGDSVYFTNQSAGSITAAKIVLGQTPDLTTRTIRAGIGARTMAIDQLDKLLLVVNQGSGEVILIDLVTNAIVGRINGVQAEDEDNGKNDKDDRDRASNAPSVTSLAPARADRGITFLLTINGKNFDGFEELIFLNANSATDKSITVSNIRVNSAGTQLTAVVAISSNASVGNRVVRVETHNGESTKKGSSANNFHVDQ